MNRVNEMIYALRKCAKEHENEVGYTGQVMTSSLCRDVADYLEADQWHYPSKGELPEKDVKCLVHTIADNYYVALIDSSDKCWCTGEMFEKILRPGDIDRWQYIIPPKEEE